MKQLKSTTRRGKARSASPARIILEEASASDHTVPRSPSALAAYAAAQLPQHEAQSDDSPAVLPPNFEDLVDVASEPESPIPQRSDIPGRNPLAGEGSDEDRDPPPRLNKRRKNAIPELEEEEAFIAARADRIERHEARCTQSFASLGFS